MGQTAKLSPLLLSFLSKGKLWISIPYILRNISPGRCEVCTYHTLASASSMVIIFSLTIIISWIRSSSLIVISLATYPTSSPAGKSTEITSTCKKSGTEWAILKLDFIQCSDTRSPRGSGWPETDLPQSSLIIWFQRTEWFESNWGGKTWLSSHTYWPWMTRIKRESANASKVLRSAPRSTAVSCQRGWEALPGMACWALATLCCGLATSPNLSRLPCRPLSWRLVLDVLGFSAPGPLFLVWAWCVRTDS